VSSDDPDTPPASPRRLRGLRATEVGGREVPIADRPVARLLGLALLDRDRASPGLLIPRCHAIHTFGMRFPIDVVFLDSSGEPISRRRAVPPCRVVVERRAASVLELPA
jgi:uncharacterized protein